MQTDMHFYATYSIARLAGLPDKDAFTVAYSAQFVDDSNKRDSEPHKDRGIMLGIATAHHPFNHQNLESEDNEEDQRRVWVPFHFIPGGEGNSLEEKLICTIDSAIANEMFDNHVKIATTDKKKFGFHLLGIAAHVYMDTFSHYGFSGITSEYNNINQDTIEFVTPLKLNIKDYIIGKCDRLLGKLIGLAADNFSGLGHGTAATYPDRPYLHWRCEYEKDRSDNSVVSDRDNPKTFLDGCRKLHQHLSKFAKQYYANSNNRIEFESVAEDIKEILNFQGKEGERSEQWLEFIKLKYPKEDVPHYSHEKWENEKGGFHNKINSQENIDTDVYRFHQAAVYHRYYVLKDLLPDHGIMVY